MRSTSRATSLTVLTGLSLLVAACSTTSDPRTSAPGTSQAAVVSDPSPSSLTNAGGQDVVLAQDKGQPPSTPTRPGATRVDPKGITQVWVPAGCFQMGSNPQTDPQARPNEQPQHQVCISNGFWLDRYEVTNAAYQKFIADGGYTRRELWSDAGWQWKGSRTQPKNIDGFTAPQQPRVGINWFEAEAYAKWRGGRLPTEAEWEYAARGPQGTIYPWGNTYELGRANVNETGIGGQRRGVTLPVGSFPNGKSWVGAEDMAGNVWEWTASWYDAAYYQQRIKTDPPGAARGELRVARGSSWYLDPANARSVTRRDRPFVLETVSGIRVAS